MTIKELYRSCLLQLQQVYSLSEATVITDWVFESIAGIKRATLVKTPKAEPAAETLKQLKLCFSQLLQHRPVQYVLGEAWFYHLKLKVNENVLIPRPETEELVELVIGSRKLQITDPMILDIGTGSGCIPIAIKKNLPATIVTALDLSEGALLVARENAAHYNCAINFIQMDFLDEARWKSLPQFDIIISNPPYIPESEKNSLAENVLRYEPHTALFVPADSPLLFYEKIAAFGKTHLRTHGKIYLETHESYAHDVLAIFSKDYPGSGLKQDLYGKNRMVIVST